MTTRNDAKDRETAFVSKRVTGYLYPDRCYTALPAQRQQEVKRATRTALRSIYNTTRAAGLEYPLKIPDSINVPGWHSPFVPAARGGTPAFDPNNNPINFPGHTLNPAPPTNPQHIVQAAGPPAQPAPPATLMASLNEDSSEEDEQDSTGEDQGEEGFNEQEDDSARKQLGDEHKEDDELEGTGSVGGSDGALYELEYNEDNVNGEEPEEEEMVVAPNLAVSSTSGTSPPRPVQQGSQAKNVATPANTTPDFPSLAPLLPQLVTAAVNTDMAHTSAIASVDEAPQIVSALRFSSVASIGPLALGLQSAQGIENTAPIEIPSFSQLSQASVVPAAVGAPLQLPAGNSRAIVNSSVGSPTPAAKPRNPILPAREPLPSAVPTPEQVAEFLSLGPHWNPSTIAEFTNHEPEPAPADPETEVSIYDTDFHDPCFYNALLAFSKLRPDVNRPISYFRAGKQPIWVEENLGLTGFDAFSFLDMLEDAIKAHFGM